MTTEIRRAKFSDSQKIGELIRECYGDLASAKYPERWNWLFRNNPFQSKKEPTVFVAFHEGKLVGQFCGMDIPLKLGKSIYNGAWCFDLMITEKSRGIGAGRLLFEAFFKVYKTTLGIWYSPPTEYLYLSIGGVRLPASIVYEKLAETHKTVSNENVSQSGVKFVQVDKFGADVDRLWKRVKAQYGNLVVRSSKYLNWKFGDVPFAEYSLFLAIKGKVTVGYVVLRKGQAPEQNIGMIADVFASPRDAKLLEELYQFASDHMKKLNVDSFLAANTHAAHQKALESVGYMVTDKTQVPLFVCQKGQPSYQGFKRSARSSWLIARGDSDWDQYPAALTFPSLKQRLMDEKLC